MRKLVLLITTFILASCTPFPASKLTQVIGGSQVPISAVYLTPTTNAQIAADDLAKHPDIKVVHSSDELKAVATSWVPIWIDKDAVTLVDQKWIEDVSLQRYPIVLVGYGVALYAFRDVLFDISGASGPVIDWSKERLGPGFSIWIASSDEERRRGALGVDRGYMQPPTVTAILDATRSQWR